MIASGAWVLFADHRLNAKEIQGSFDWPPHLWPTIFDFPFTDYAWIALIGLTSFGVAVAGVARQRRGDARTALPWIPNAGFPEQIVNLFRFPCPTSSAMRAQVWFDLKSSGLPVLAIGLLIVSVNALLSAVSVLVVWLRPIALMWTGLSVLAILILGTNAFGIRYTQGRLYASAFEATQAAGSAQLAGLKVIVRSVCVLAALIVLGVSAWGSLSFIAVGKLEPLSSWQRAIEGAVGALTGYQQVALAVVLSIGLTIMVASHAVFGALYTRYSRRVNIAGSVVLLYGLALALLVLAGRRGVASAFLLDAFFGTTRWIVAAAMVLATIYLFWSGLAERFLTVRYVCSVLLVSAAFGAAWLTMLPALGVQLDGMTVTNAVSWLSPVLLLLMISGLSPWSLNRIRHT
jgi:hypothetical protein